MKNILIVDKKVKQARKIAKSIEAVFSNFRVAKLSGLDSLKKELNSNHTDLIIIGLKTFKEKDRDELLDFLNKNYSNIPKIFFESNSIFLSENVKGKFDCIEKPLDIDTLKKKITDLFGSDKNQFKQQILTLQSFMKLIKDNKKTCTLSIKSKKNNAYLYFLEGELTHITTDNTDSAITFDKISCWDNKVITISDEYEKSENKTLAHTNKLLTEVKEKNNKNTNTEKKMNKELFEEALKTAERELGNAFLAGSFYLSGDGQPIVSFQKTEGMNPAAANALFDRVTSMMQKSLKDSNFPAQLNRYYIMDLTNNLVALVLLIGEFQCGMLVNMKEASMGLLLNVVLPKTMAVFEKQ